MTLEQLMAMGLTEEQAKEVMKSLDGNFVPKSRFNEVNEAKKRLEAQQGTGKAGQQDGKQAPAGEGEQAGADDGTLAAVQQQVATLTAQLEAEKQAREQDKHRHAVETLMDNALRAANVQSITAAKAFLKKPEEYELEEGGKAIKGFADEIKALQTHDEAKILFAQQDAGSGKSGMAGFVPSERRDGSPSGSKPATFQEAVEKAVGKQLEGTTT